jgi:hypothetical protein
MGGSLLLEYALPQQGLWHVSRFFGTRVWRAIDECLWWRAVSSSFEPWVLKWNIHIPSNSLQFVFD